jgi:hypothetical protein
MPRGTNKRRRDPAQLAKLIVDIATGEVEDREPTPEEQGKDPAAAAYPTAGGEEQSSSLPRPPTVAGYFGRVSKERIIEAVREGVSAEACPQLRV